MMHLPETTVPQIVNKNLEEDWKSQPISRDSTVRVLIAEHSEVFRLGLSQFVDICPDFVLVEVASAREESIAMAAELKPDVLVLDVHLANLDGLETAKEVKARSPNTEILIFGESREAADVRAILHIPVRGYLLKDASFEQVGRAIRQVKTGQDYISESLANDLLDRPKRAYLGAGDSGRSMMQSVLTAREQNVLVLVCEGLTNNQIGAELNLAEKTVKHYLTSIYRKLDVRSRAQAICAVNDNLHRVDRVSY